MKVATAVVLLSAAMLPLRAEASWFEFCRMEGLVESATPTTDAGHRSFDFRVIVSSARRDETARPESYMDCAEYAGNSVLLRVDLSLYHGKPAAGDKIVFTRSVVNGFADPATGEITSRVQVKLLAYDPAATD